MRLRNIPGSREAIGACEYVVPEESECAGKWHEIFGNENEIHTEVGTGKGRFLMELAKAHPEIFQRTSARHPENGRESAFECQVYPHGGGTYSAVFCKGRGWPGLSELFRSLA